MNNGVVKISVKADNRAYAQIGNNKYSFNDAISELIDNAIAARVKECRLEIKIKVGISKKAPNQCFIEILDNAQGISIENIPKALSLGSECGGGDLNEHGMGMKQAVASLGKLDSLITKTNESSWAIKINKLEYGDQECELINENFNHGTKVRIKELNAIVPKEKQQYTKKVVGYLSARYRRFLQKADILIYIEYLNLDKENDKKLWIVEKPTYPVFFHPINHSNEPIILREPICGHGWKANITLGLAPTEDQYKELDISSPKNYDPYYVSLNNQGLDIVMYDRVIMFHQLSEINIVQTKHNSNNYIRGEIELVEGFTSLITKNDIRRDYAFDELIEKVSQIIENTEGLNFKKYPTRVTREILINRIINSYRYKSPLCKFQKSHRIKKLAGVIDIVLDNIVYGVNVNVADSNDVYVLFSYMDIGGFSEGCLVAKKFDDSALFAVDFILEKHQKCIELKTQKELGIAYPITPDESGRIHD